jgi:hypothetical protein
MKTIFDIINWILKKPKKPIESSESVSTYLLNRWLSMSGQQNSIIINETINKWYYPNSIYNNSLMVSKFFRVILPKSTHKINYLKKNKIKKEKIKDQQCFDYIEREISKREFDVETKLIEELNTLCK